MKAASEFPAFAAETLGVPAERLTAATGVGDLPEWDSVAHLGLIMATERAFGVAIPLARMAKLRTAADFIAAIEEGRS